MGFEIRRVPLDWQHPKDDHGEYVPLHPSGYCEFTAREKEAWVLGWVWDLEGYFAQHDAWVPGWRPKTPREAEVPVYEDWHDTLPRTDDCMPLWASSEGLGYAWYENSSSGTPITPVFATLTALAQYSTAERVSFGVNRLDGASPDHWAIDYPSWLQVPIPENAL